MAAFHPRFEDLPSEFAVFPLSGALMLPRGKLPLNIFESRYLAMIEDSLAAGRMFGMIQPDANAPASDAGEGLYRVGCLGRLSSFSETDDGRLLITLTGLIRFTIRTELSLRRGYRVVRGDFGDYRDDLTLDRPPADIERESILAALRAYFTRRSVDSSSPSPWPAPSRRWKSRLCWKPRPTRTGRRRSWPCYKWALPVPIRPPVARSVRTINVRVRSAPCPTP
jgi:Lon protease-like protein